MLIIRDADGSMDVGDLELGQTSDTPPNCRFAFRSPRRKEVTVENSDFFECLVDLRRIIEAEGGRILCQGGRRDVFPSPMQRRTAGGLKADVQRLGEKALEQDMVNVLDEAEADLIGTIDEQRAFHEAWLVSLGWQKTKAGSWFMTDPSKTPSAGEIEEARRFPNGTVSRIGGGYSAEESAPREAIEGCWEVDGQGRIVERFLKNPHYDPDHVKT